MAGRAGASDEVIEVLYRERFGLSHHQMQEEPAEAVEYWASLEAARQQKR